MNNSELPVSPLPSINKVVNDVPGLSPFTSWQFENSRLCLYGFLRCLCAVLGIKQPFLLHYEVSCFWIFHIYWRIIKQISWKAQNCSIIPFFPGGGEWLSSGVDQVEHHRWSLCLASVFDPYNWWSILSGKRPSGFINFSPL